MVRCLAILAALLIWAPVAAASVDAAAKCEPKKEEPKKDTAKKPGEPAIWEICVEAEPAEGEAEGAEKADAKKAEGEHGGEGDKDGPPCPAGPQYVMIGPVSVPVLSGNVIRQYVSIVVNLETPDYKAARAVKPYIPKLTDAYLSRLYSAFAVNNGVNNGLVDVEVLRARLVKANEKVLPAGLVSDVLLQMVHQTNR